MREDGEGNRIRRVVLSVEGDGDARDSNAQRHRDARKHLCRGVVCRGGVAERRAAILVETASVRRAPLKARREEPKHRPAARRPRERAQTIRLDRLELGQRLGAHPRGGRRQRAPSHSTTGSGGATRPVARAWSCWRESGRGSHAAGAGQTDGRNPSEEHPIGCVVLAVDRDLQLE